MADLSVNVQTTVMQDAAMQAEDLGALALRALTDAAAIFTAIRDATPADSQPHRLAGVGCHITDDFANCTDYQAGELKRLLLDLAGRPAGIA